MTTPGRGAVAEREVPPRLVEALPGMFQQDDFTSRFVSAFDAVSAPLFEALDCVVAYLDPDTAPVDFLEWLAGWFGLGLDPTWPEDRRRRALRRVVELYRWRGTVRGLRGQLNLYLGPQVEFDIEEGGAVVWSPTPGNDPPGQDGAAVRVTVRTPPGSEIDADRLQSLVRRVTPAHLAVSVSLDAGAGEDP